jgi:hypothetical protein
MDKYNTFVDLDFIDMNELLENIEYIQGDIKILLSTKKNINILWGIQPRDLPNLEFLIAIIQIVKFIKNGFMISVLLADIHELLDSPQLTLDIIKIRCDAYMQLIIQLVDLFDVNSNNINFIFGSSFQTSPSYTLDIYKISSMTTIQQTYNAREIDNLDKEIHINDSDKKMTTMLYPILQALDEKYTNCDIFYGSITQKNMCKYSTELMNKFQHKNDVIYLLQDLTKKIKISFFDPLDCIKNKLELFTLDEINYLNEKITFPLLKYRYDKMIINGENINSYSEYNKYIYDNNIIKEQIIDITSIYLSKHLDKFYDTLISSKFMDYYNHGWLGYKN